MAFGGDLSNISLADVFQNLFNNRQTGTLTVSAQSGSFVAMPDEKSPERHVFFREGKVAMYSAGRGVPTPLGRYLVARGLLHASDLQDLESRREKGMPLASAVVAAGLTDAMNVAQTLREYAMDEICDLFMLRAGSFRFVEGEPPEGLFDGEMAATGLTLEVNEVIMEAARRADELGRLGQTIGGLGDIYIPVAGPAGDAGIEDPDQQYVAALMNGRRDLADIIREAAIGRFRTLRAVAELARAGRARVARPEDLFVQAELAHSAGDRLETTRLYRRALEIEHGNVQARRRLAEVLTASGDARGAAVEYKRIGGMLLDRRERSEALDCLMRAAELVPDDVDCRERCLKLAVEIGNLQQAERIGTMLARKYEEMGLCEKACQTYERLLKLHPADPGPIRLALAEAYIRMGRMKDGVRALKTYASDCLASRRDGEAAGALRRALQLDPSDAAVQRRLKEIETGIVERKRERWKWIKRTVAAAALAAAAVAAAVHEIGARMAFDEANLRAHRLAVEGKLDGIPAIFREAAGRYRYSWAGWTARGLAAEYSRIVAQRKVAGAEEAEKAGDIRTAERLYEEARAAGTAGDSDLDRRIEQALARIRAGPPSSAGDRDGGGPPHPAPPNPDGLRPRER
ncbi:MAG: DUF4388 domain-containing protein [Planctomycetota bacterium]|nr:DUF4388 domain-containing protein [Planctomycetota bacterium]